MEKKFELDSELDLLLDEQLMREAELLEKELFADKNKELYTETEDETQASYERLIARLKVDGVYRDEETAKEMSVNKTEAPKKFNSTQRCLGRGKKLSIRRETWTDEQKRRRRRRISAKIAGVLVVSGMCVFTATMTSEANRHYIINSMRIMTGRDTRIVNDNDETNEKVNEDEYAAIAEIEEQLGIEMPEFLYRPYGFCFASYELDLYAGIARVEYQYGDNIVVIYVNKNRNESETNTNGLSGDEIEKIQAHYEMGTVSLGKIKGEQDEIPNYYAQWDRENTSYFLSGKIEFEELREIVKKIVF